jgi:hypothetical protein
MMVGQGSIARHKITNNEVDCMQYTADYQYETGNFTYVTALGPEKYHVGSSG